MNNIQKKDLGKNTFQFEIGVPWGDVKKEYEKVFDEMTSELQVEGFRKGKAPKKLAEKHIKKDEVFKKILDKLIPNLYSELIKKEGLKPVISPKITLISASEEKDWQIRFTVAEAPAVKLNDFPQAIIKAKKDEKGEDIWTPGKEVSTKDEEDNQNEKKNRLMNKIFETVLKNSDAEISDLIIEAELERRLTQLVDDVRKVGLTVEAYLKSKNETMESIKARFKSEIEEMYKLEFALETIANQEKIVVEKADLDKLFENIKDEKQREEARKNAYFYASVLKRQKTLDFLLNL